MPCMFCTKCGGCELGRITEAHEEGTCLLCGLVVPKDALACPSCGTPILATAPGQSMSKERESRSQA